MTANALPMSRTKWVLSGPVSGTAAGRPAYHPAGSASIQPAFARLPSPNTTSAHHQESARSPDRIAAPPCVPRGGARSFCRWSPARSDTGGRRVRLAHDRAEARDALVDGLHVERREGQDDMVGAAAVATEHVTARVRDATRERRLMQAIGIGAGRQGEPHEDATPRRRPACALGHLARERGIESREAGGVE